MFVGTDVIEFINKIINQSDVKDKDKVKQNITKFREYLRLTCMADEATLTDIDLILSCIDEIMIVKSKLGNVQRMSYQMINSLDIDIMPNVIRVSEDYINSIKRDDQEFLKYLEHNQNLKVLNLLIADC